MRVAKGAFVVSSADVVDVVRHQGPKGGKNQVACSTDMHKPMMQPILISGKQKTRSSTNHVISK